MRRTDSYGGNRDGRTVASCFWENVAHASRSPALVQCHAGGNVAALSWGELGLRATRYVALLRAASERGGCSRPLLNEQIASCLPNSVEWILLDLAAQTLGWVHAAVDVREPLGRQESLVQFSRSRWLLKPSTAALSTSTGGGPELELCDRATQTTLPLSQWCAALSHGPSVTECQSLAEAVEVNSAAQILFTSGSVGQPKGVLLSHRNLLSNAFAKLDAAPQDSCDLRLNILPFSHAYARTCELTSWIVSGGQLALAKDWSDVLRQARLLNPTLINLVPYLAERLADVLDDDRYAMGRKLRLLQVGGAALHDELWQRLQQHDLPPLQGYGLTEAGPVVCSNRAGSQRPGSVGPPVQGVELRVDEHHVLWCRGPNIMLGYWDDPDASREALLSGWLRTGDLARLEADGHAVILGRASQQIVLSTGYKVCPEPIERQLQADPWIERAIVFGQGQPHVVALIWPSQNCPAAAVATLSDRIEQRLCDLPRHAIPRKFALVQAPLTEADGCLTLKGVPRRRQIADRYREVLQSLYQRLADG